MGIHDFGVFRHIRKIILVPFFISGGMAQVTVSGYVRTYTGVPIAGATVKLVTLNRTTTTDAEGHYDFSNSLAVRSGGASGFSLVARGAGLALKMDRPEMVSVSLFDWSGRRAHVLVDEFLPPGEHTVALGQGGQLNRLLLAEVRVGSVAAWYKMSLQGNFVALSEAQSPPGRALAMTAAAADSINVTHPNYHGGLNRLDGRRVSATTGVQNFRLFSTDPAWNVCAPTMNFQFDASAGAAYYQRVIPNYQATEQEVLREVCQSIWRTPAEVGRKYTSYTANIKTGAGGQVASTGGSTLNFSTEYINNKPWYELVGVQIHEGNHSYQPYYNTTGASGFGEAMPDAIRGLTGFFRWAPGNRCSGGFAATYQGGGKYWYYIEMKHPGFIYGIYKLTAGDISARVQQVTGESLSALASQCETTGMPPGGA